MKLDRKLLEERKDIERQQKKIDIGLRMMSQDLGDNAWCAGHGYTLADISVGVCLGWLSFRFPEIRWRDQFPPTNTPSAEVARKAREKFGWLLEGKKG